jgi:hypothetical protein
MFAHQTGWCTVLLFLLLFRQRECRIPDQPPHWIDPPLFLVSLKGVSASSLCQFGVRIAAVNTDDSIPIED